MKICEVGRAVPFGRTDGRTDMKLIIAFRNFAEAPRKV